MIWNSIMENLFFAFFTTIGQWFILSFVIVSMFALVIALYELTARQ
jgi:uncharacterized membrane protein